MDLLSLLSGILGGSAIKGGARASAQAIPAMQRANMVPSRTIPQDQLGQASQEYAANPQDPKFLGVDPMQFGYPADNSAQQPQGLHMLPPWMNNFQIQGSQGATQPAAQPNLLQHLGAGVTGANNPIPNIQRGGTVYSPGEGPFIPSRSRPGNGAQYR